MKMKFLAAIAVALATVTTANAGGMLTNTNQSIAFLRNPAREAAIGIDGVYSNPAGVAFLKDGWHVGVNWQCAVQTRTVTETSPYLDHTLKILDNKSNPKTQTYRGHATAPFIPSVSAAYNHKKWSFQFHFAVSGGGGKCQYENGLGDFESQVGKIAGALNQMLDNTVHGYGVDCYMEGRQYYYGVTLGAAYKVLPNLSVYAGVRGLIASASYAARLQNIQVSSSHGLQYLSEYLSNSDIAAKIASAGTIYGQYLQNPAMLQQYQQYAAAGVPGAADAVKAMQGYPTLAKLGGYAEANGLDLASDQSGFGIAPILGIDYKIWRLNFALKYEFRTKMNLKNSSNLTTEPTMAATAQYQDGVSVREDSPALLAFGVQYTPIDIVRINLGYHHFYDMDAKKTYFTQASLGAPIVRHDDKNSMLDHGTNEYLGGVEVDCTDRLIVSCGAQITRYGNTDEYMSDQSFVTNSWSFGFGASYQANPNVKIEAAYFKTFYSDYNTATSAAGESKSFSRTNDVIGVGLVMNF